MTQQLSKGALRTRDRFFAALRTMALRDMATARIARRVEHQINEALFQIERFVASHRHAGVRSPGAAPRIAATWLELAADCVEIDEDLADVVTLFARQWLSGGVPPERARQWVQRAECMIRLLSVRGEHRSPKDELAVGGGATQPLVTLVLRSLPRGAQPEEVEVDLGDGAVIGRADGCDWVLPGEVVSRHHAKLRYDPARRAFFVTNLSRNGLGIDDEVTLQGGSETELSVGTMLSIPKEGHYRILVQSVFVPAAALAAALAAGGAWNGADADEPVAAGGRADGPLAQADAPRALPVWAVEVRDPTGVVQRIYEQYGFLPAAAGQLVRDYVYGEVDATALVAAIFADVVVPRR